MKAGKLGGMGLIYLSGPTEGNTLCMSADTSQANVENTLLSSNKAAHSGF